MMTRPLTVFAAVGALALATAALVMILSGSGSSYTVRAQFTDASQLVKGDLVEVAGRRVGLVEKIDLADNGLAEVTLELESDEVTPLHEGTRAAVRTIGLSGVANRFVHLTPGPPTTPEIRDGGVLPTTQTRGVVDLDAVLNALDPETRRDVQGIVRDAAVALNPESARQTNAGLEMLNPAMSQLADLGRQLTLDQAALSSLLEQTSGVAGVLARHREQLGRGIDAGAGVFTALASEREALSGMLARAPTAMRALTSTLRRVRTQTLPAVDPLVVGARPAIAPLGAVLRKTKPTLDNAQPLIERMRKLVPEARAVLEPLPAGRDAAVPAIAAIAKGLRDALPMVSGLRPYTPELVSGFFSGFGGNSSHSYDANGHYARIYFVGSPGSLNGLVPNPPDNQLQGYRTGLDARCPGAAEEPHPDGSNPWAEGANPPGRNGCNPEDNK